MNVKELREAIDANVDPEAIYVPDSTWSGDVYSLHHTAEDNC